MGSLCYALAVQRTYIKPGKFDPEREGIRRSLVLHELLFEEPSLDAILPGMLSNQNNVQDHNRECKAALNALDRILARVER